MKLSSKDTSEKTKAVDLIYVVDVSGSMGESNKLNLVKESLTHLSKLMKKEDKLAIVAFSGFPHIKLELTEMIEENKQKAFKAIDELYASGGTDIYDGLRTGLDLITNDYISGDRVVSMILLIDGLDYNSNADKRFKKI